jgi:hypothetical protein
MTELGEKVSISEFVSDEVHNEGVCPWHEEEDQGESAAMDPQEADEDAAVVPKNLGKKLGQNLEKAKDRPPSADTVPVRYRQGDRRRYKQGQAWKQVRIYEREEQEEMAYALQYAPHHLIPGNESLKRSKVVPYLGDDDTIKNYAEGQASRIKKGQSVGFDVNAAENGVWLPSPYALSNSNDWPAEPGIKAIKKRRGMALIGQQTEDFKLAYAAAAIEAAGMRQFHMRHSDYSAKVKNVLDKIAVRLRSMARFACPVAGASKRKRDDSKVDAPMGLPARLRILQNNLRRLLTGPVWRAPFFTDDLTRAYAEDRLARTTAKGDLEQVI